MVEVRFVHRADTNHIVFGILNNKNKENESKKYSLINSNCDTWIYIACGKRGRSFYSVVIGYFGVRRGCL